MSTHCGFVALLGRPNAGKSTLLNALVGDKVAVVSRKPQTTRNRILGLAIEGETQIAFLDTPGIHHSKNKTLINTAMNRVALQTGADADLIVYLVDLDAGWSDADQHFLQKILSASTAPFVVAASKADLVQTFFIDSQLARIENSLEDYFKTEIGAAHKPRLMNTTNSQGMHTQAMLVSAKRPEMVAEFRKFLADFMPESPWHYAKDDLTDMPQSFVCGELIREQIFRQFGEEIPYSAAVRVTAFEDKPTIVVIKADIVVGHKSHKGMIIGERGKAIKDIGTEARKSLEKHLGKKVFLELNVEVSENWVADKDMIAELAHLSDLPALGKDLGAHLT